MIPYFSLTEQQRAYARHPSRYKQIKLLAQFNGTDWEDISEYVKSVETINRMEYFNTYSVDNATIILANQNEEFTPTVYNDVYDPANGKFNGTVDDGYLNKEFRIKLSVILEDTTEIDLFDGIVTEIIADKNKTAKMQVKDLMYLAQKTKLTSDTISINSTPTYIIEQLLQGAGVPYTGTDLQSTSTQMTAVFQRDSSYLDAINTVVKASAGFLTAVPKVYYRTRVENYSDPASLNLNEEFYYNGASYTVKNDYPFNAYKINSKRQINKVKVTSRGYYTDSDYSNVINSEIEGLILKQGKVSELEFNYESDFATDIQDIVIDYMYGQVGQYLNNYVSAGWNDTRLSIDSINIYADKIVIVARNVGTSGYDIEITKVRVEGKKIRQTDEIIVSRETGETPEKELTFESYYNDQTIVEKLTDIAFDDSGKAVKFELQMTQFYPDLYAGCLVDLEVAPKGIATSKFIVEQVNHKIDTKWRTSLVVREWTGLNYKVGNKTVNSSKIFTGTISDITDISELAQTIDERTQYIDGVAPNPPSNLSVSKGYDNNIGSYIALTWTASDSLDAIGYEVGYQYDGQSEWHSTTTGDTAFWFNPIADKLIHLRVRTIDAEGKYSTYITADITSDKDITPPSVPQNISASALYRTIAVRWDNNTEPDFHHYELLYDTDSGFSAPDILITTDNNIIISQFKGNPLTSETTYYFKVRAVDKTGNQSSYSSVVNATTTKIADDDLNSSSLNQAIQDLNDLETTVSNVENYTRQITFVLNSGFEDAKGQASLDGWNTWAGAGSVVQVSDGVAGKYAITNNDNTVWWLHSNKIAVDTNDTYIVECKARTISGSTGTFYLAVVLFDENGNNISGDGTWWYYPALAVVPPSEWTNYNGLFGAGTPKPFPSNAKYMAVGVILNYNGGNSKMQVQVPRIRLVMDSVYIKDAAITNAKIHDLSADKITAGFISADRIDAGTITSDKLDVGQLSSISANIGTITAGVLQKQSGTTRIDLNNDLITVDGGDVKIGKGALTDGSNGISINNGKFEMTNSNGKLLLDAEGIKQIYNISMIDQIDDAYGLDIPIYIPENADGTGSSVGKARVIVKVEKYRAFAKAETQGSTAGGTTGTVWDSAGVYVNTDILQWTGIDIYTETFTTDSGTTNIIINNGGGYSDTIESGDIKATWVSFDINSGTGFRGDGASTISVNSHVGSDYTLYAGSHDHGGGTDETSAGTVPSGSTGFINGGSPDTDHTHSLITANTNHSHSIASDGSHRHTFSLTHSHTIDTADINAHQHKVTINSADLYHKHDVVISIAAHDHAITDTGHIHSIGVGQFDHYHQIDLNHFKHSHTVSIDSHTHNLNYGIYESSDTATVTIEHYDTSANTTTQLFQATTGNKGEYSNLSVEDGDIIKISSTGLARVVVFIFVEYTLK